MPDPWDVSGPVCELWHCCICGADVWSPALLVRGHALCGDCVDAILEGVWREGPLLPLPAIRWWKHFSSSTPSRGASLPGDVL